MSELILNAQRLYRRVMGEEPPSSLTANRCHSNGDLSFLTKPYRCVAATNQLINVRSILPKATFLFSTVSAEDAYDNGTQVTIMWEEEDWNVNTPMVISDNGWCNFYVDSDAFDSADDGYYLTTSGTTRTYYYVEYGVVLDVGQYTPAGGVVADLQNMWMRDTSLDLPGWIGFKSQAHKGIQSSYDVVKITISGVTSFEMKIRSYAESYYDYTMASILDASGYPLYHTDSNMYVDTYGKQQSGTSLADYETAKYTGISTGEHVIYVSYRKDLSGDRNNDEGYLLLPDTATFINSYVPAPTSDIYLKYHDTIGTGDNFETITANDTYVFPWLNAIGAWTVTCDQPWITPMFDYSWHGDSAVMDEPIWCNVEPNTTGVTRTAVLTAFLDGTSKGGIYTITQLG